MKTIFIVVVLVAIAGAAFYYLGGYHSFDPSQQGRDARKAIKPGMTLGQVLDAAGEPREYSQLRKDTTKAGGETIERIVPVGPVAFKRGNVERRIADAAFPEGFVLHYKFSESVAFDVQFDQAGAVTGVQDATTLAELLDLKQ